MSHQRKIPKETGWDHSIELLREGYYFILNRTGKFDSRVVLTRILGAKTICMVGKKEAELFYDTDKFYREEAAPTSAQKTILGQGGVQGLDGEEHRHRKAMFMSLMTKEALNEIQQLTKEEWQSYINKETDEVEIYEAAKVVLTRIALRWTGVPYKEEEVQYWASNLSPLFEYASKIGPKNIKSRWSRQKLESKLEDLIQKVRKERINVDRSRAFYQFSMHKDLNGELLDQHIAAVELLNLIRPLVAIAVYINFTF
ncbi:hypothetical protein [Piscibacillus salipiscarius]|nr:hypothetical protein [Piscibacillus salipiscarius]